MLDAKPVEVEKLVNTYSLRCWAMATIVDSKRYVAMTTFLKSVRFCFYRNPMAAGDGLYKGKCWGDK